MLVTYVLQELMFLKVDPSLLCVALSLQRRCEVVKLLATLGKHYRLRS